MSQRPLILQTLHKNVQRLASLALCISGGGAVRPTTATRLGQTYRELVSGVVRVGTEDADRALAYLTERALIRKYGAKNAEDLRAKLVDGRVRIESQDWWLSDPDLPSQTGGEREQSFAKTVTVCQELGFLAEKTLTTTSYGRMLLDIARDRGVLPGANGSPGSPFAVATPFALAAFYRVAQFDVPMQRRLVEALAPGELRFQDLCLEAEPMLRGVLTEVPNSVPTRAVRSWLIKEIDNARKLAARVVDSGWSEAEGAAVQTLYRPFEDMFLPRLEFMVDAGLATKPEPARYVYAPAPDFASWREVIAGGVHALESSYFSVMSTAHRRRARRLTDPSDILDHMTLGFTKFRGLTGYAPILETVMYSNVTRWDEDPWVFVEITDSIDALRAASSGESPQVRILSDRYRKPEAFSLVVS